MNDNKFIDGLFVKAPREGAPDFVKGSLSMKRVELLNWLSNQEDEWVNVDIKESKAGKWYAQVNDWKPSKPQVQNAPEGEDYGDMGFTSSSPSTQDVGDIPF